MHTMGCVLRIRSLFNCSLSCLLIRNLAYLTIDYVKYETETKVAPYFSVRLDVIKLSLCFSISSLLELEGKVLQVVSRHVHTC